MKTIYSGMFHPVGQGLFHSADLLLGSEKPHPFRYIFDCGADGQGRLNAAVEKYLKSLGRKRTLDILFLSHMHKDHVSGLDLLLKGKKGLKGVSHVRQAILPYLYPWERACLLAIAQESEFFLDDPPDWFVDFLKQPAKFLHDAGVEEIVFVRGGDEPNANPDTIWISPNPISPQSKQKEHDFSEQGLKGYPLDRRREAEIREVEASMSGDEYGSYSRFVTSVAPLQMGAWVFILFNKELDPDKLQQLKEGFESLRGSLELEQVLRMKAKVVELTSLYKQVFGQNRLNDSSLALFSGYVVKGLDTVDVQFEWENGLRRIQSEFELRTVDGFDALGFLFTGDLPVNQAWREFARKFGQDGGDVKLHNQVYQVPHHGSRHNWNTEQLSILHNPVYAISAGLKRRHHPSPSVLADLANANKSIARVHETDHLAHQLVVTVGVAELPAVQRPSLAAAYARGVIRPGQTLYFDYTPRGGSKQHFEGILQPHGIEVGGTRYSSLSKAALACIQSVCPSRRSANGWTIWRDASETSLLDLLNR